MYKLIKIRQHLFALVEQTKEGSSDILIIIVRGSL